MFLVILFYLFTCLFIAYGELTTLPFTIHEEDFHKTTLKDTGFENAHPERIPTERRTRKKIAVRKHLDPEPVCKLDMNPFEIRRLYKTFDNDGGKVKYVSADSLNVDEQDVKKLECISAKTKEPTHGAKNHSVSQNGTVKDEKKAKQARRGYEYQFDTIEYYDDELQFDESQCPGLVDVIELELAEIRRYDVECELIMLWESLL